jgi:hypothetical protein
MLEISKASYRALRQKLETEMPPLDERTLTDTLEGLTDLHDVISAIVRSSLEDEAVARGLRGRLREMQQRIERLETRAAKGRLIAKDVMAEEQIKKVTAPDFTVSLRQSSCSVVIVEESKIPNLFWTPQPPKLDRSSVLAALKAGSEVPGAKLSNGDLTLSVRVD